MQKVKIFFIGLVVVFGGFLLWKYYLPSFPIKSVLYTIDHPKNPQILAKYPYLQNISGVTYWQTLYNGEQIMATSSKDLSKSEFIDIIDDLIKSGYVQQGGWNQTMEITQRNVKDDENEFIITDEGINSVYNDTPPLQTTKSRILLEYRYDKSNNTIYFNASK